MCSSQCLCWCARYGMRSDRVNCCFARCGWHAGQRSALADHASGCEERCPRAGNTNKKRKVVQSGFFRQLSSRHEHRRCWRLTAYGTLGLEVGSPAKFASRLGCLLSVLGPLIALVLYPSAKWLFAFALIGVAVLVLNHLLAPDPTPNDVAGRAERLLNGTSAGWDVDDYEHLNPHERRLNDLWQSAGILICARCLSTVPGRRCSASNARNPCSDNGSPSWRRERRATW